MGARGARKRRSQQRRRKKRSRCPSGLLEYSLTDGQCCTWTAREKETYAINCGFHKWSRHVGLQPIVACSHYQSLQSWHKEHVDTAVGPAA